MKSKIGFHVNRIDNSVLDKIISLKPRVVKVLDPNYDWLKKARPHCEFIIYREFVNYDEQNLGSNPSEARLLGISFADRVLRHEAVKDGLIDLCESYNELVITPNDNVTHSLYDSFQSGFYDRLREQSPCQPIAFNFGNGHFMGDTALKYYPLTCEKYMYFGFHEYDWPTMDRLHQEGVEAGNGGYWLAGRYKRIMPDIIDVYGSKHAVITECGLTQAVHEGQDDVGYLAEPRIPDEDYIETMHWYDDLLKGDYYVKGSALFVVGATHDWETFESLPVIDEILNNDSGGIEPPPIDPPIGDNMINVIDERPPNDESLNAVPRLNTWEDVKRELKCDVSRAYGYDAANDGEYYWELTDVQVSVGPTIYKVTLKDGSSNSPVPSILIFNHWPDAEQITSGIQPPYHPNADGGFTNTYGEIDFSFGGGNVIGPNGGPNDIWVSADPPSTPNARRWSDCLVRLGWHGATDHLTLWPTFTLKVKQDQTIPPVNPPGIIDKGDFIIVTSVVHTLSDGVTTVNPIYWNPDAEVPVEFTVIDNVYYTYNGKQYNAIGNLLGE